MTTYAEIWKTLSVVDCTEHVEKKGNLSYLSWAWAWAVLMGKYPQATYEIHDELHASDGTVECRVTVRIDECERMMWLPVMDNRNNALANPDKRKISDTRMRCLVKCLAMFGLGHYIYAGEDLPDGLSAYTDAQLATYKHFIECVNKNEAYDALEFYAFKRQLPEAVQVALHNSGKPGEVVRDKSAEKLLDRMAEDGINAYVNDIEAEVSADDPHAQVLLDEVSAYGKAVKQAVWSRLSEQTKHLITERKKEAA